MKYVIIGNGVAGTQAALTIRKRYSPEYAQITLIGDETDYFFSRTALMYAFMDRMNRRDLEPYERKMYDKQQIDRIRGRVVDLEANRQELTLDSGRTVNYDRLLLAVGAKPRMLPFEGADETDEGIVHFVSMQDLDECERLAWESEKAVVVGGGLVGIELVECLNFHGLDVTFLVREPHFWPAGLHREEGKIIERHIQEHGIDLRMKEELSAIIPDDDGRVDAIETDRGNRIPCGMLGISIGVTPNVDWLERVQTPPELDEGIKVDRSFETSLPDVWAAGDCVEIDMGDGETLNELIWYTARDHGQLAARGMLGDDIRYEPPVFYNSAKFLEIEYTTVGTVTTAPEGTKTLYRKMPSEPITQRILVDKKDRVIGFNMLGSRWDHRILSTWVEQRRPLDWVRDHLHQAQFDVEFGGVDLEQMREEELRL